MTRKDPYAGFVEHPRYGRGPRITGNDGDEEGRQDWFYRGRKIIPGTAIPGNPGIRRFMGAPFRWYFDVEVKCVHCRKPFIFYAAEKKHWSETLQFVEDADAVRCVPCRKLDRQTAGRTEEYQTLRKMGATRTGDQSVRMAWLACTLFVDGVFGAKCLPGLKRSLKNEPLDKRVRKLRNEAIAVITKLESAKRE